MRNIRKIILITGAFLLLMSCVRLPIYQARILNNESITSNLRYNKEKISYDIYNDGENIHIHMATPDYLTQLKILRLGITLWLDQEGKQKKEKGIKFPLEQIGNTKYKRETVKTNEQSIHYSQYTMHQKIAQLHRQFLTFPKVITLIGMEDENNRIIINTELEKSNIQASVFFDSLNILQYKAIIPIDKVFTENEFDNGFLSIGFESSSVEMNIANTPIERSGGSRGGGSRGGGQSGGMRGGGKGGAGQSKGGGIQNSGQNSSLMKPIKIWFLVNINPSVN